MNHPESPHLESIGVLVLFGEATPGEREAYLAHLEACPSCRAGHEGRLGVLEIERRRSTQPPVLRARAFVLAASRRRRPAYRRAWGLAAGIVLAALLVLAVEIPGARPSGLATEGTRAIAALPTSLAGPELDQRVEALSDALANLRREFEPTPPRSEDSLDRRAIDLSDRIAALRATLMSEEF